MTKGFKLNIIVTHDSKRATCKSENWLLQTKDRHHMEYIENGFSYLIGMEYGTDYQYIYKFIYFDTIRKVDNVLPLNEFDKAKIQERITKALDAMGGQYELC